VHRGARSLCRILDHHGAALRRETIDLRQVDRTPVQVLDDDHRRTPAQHRLQVCEIRRERARIQVVQQNPHAGTFSGGRDVVA